MKTGGGIIAVRVNKQIIIWWNNFWLQIFFINDQFRFVCIFKRSAWNTLFKKKINEINIIEYNGISNEKSKNRLLAFSTPVIEYLKSAGNLSNKWMFLKRFLPQICSIW
jgi:hypothetical protein